MTAPRTWVTGETVTSAQMNAEIRDKVGDELITANSFTPLAGTYSSTAKVLTLFYRRNETTDANGLSSVTLASSCILSITPTSEHGANDGMWFIRADLTTTSTIVLQLKSIADGSVMSATAAIYSLRVEYQA